VAAKHGHLDVIEFLIERGANPHIRSYVSHKEKENLLEVSIRWSHVLIVEYLISNVKWKKHEITSAYKILINDSEDSTLKVIVKKYS
jgi:ankyrin repeat protein